MEFVKRISIVFFMVGITPFYSCFGQQIKKEKKLIIIDPGHGGIDSGAIGINKLKEKDVVLDIAMEILKWNKEMLNNRYEIYLTRYSDTLISLSDRTKLARILRPDLFISLHVNHSVNSKAKGIEVYIHHNIDSKRKYGRQSIEIASYIVAQFYKKLGYNIRGVKKANFQVLRQTVNICPSVLLELGFLSNMDEADHLTKKENKNAVALAILLSIKI